MKRTLTLENIEVLFTQEEIKERVKELALQIKEDYKGILSNRNKDKLVLLGILNGCVPFIGDLAKELSRYFPVGFIEIDYIAISSYRGMKSGPIRIDKDTKYPLKGKHVLLVEDIIDTGRTLQEVVGLLTKRGVKSLRICVLVEKIKARDNNLKIDYSGFAAPGHKWLVGYGLDLDGMGRELPFIGYLKQH